MARGGKAFSGAEEVAEGVGGRGGEGADAGDAEEPTELPLVSCFPPESGQGDRAHGQTARRRGGPTSAGGAR